MTTLRDVLALAERMQSETEDQESTRRSIRGIRQSISLRERRGAVTVLAPTNPEANAVAIVMAEKSDETEEDADLLADKRERFPEDKKEPEVGSKVNDIFGIAGGTAGGAAGLGIPGQSPYRGGAGGLGSAGGLRGLGGLMGGRREMDEDNGLNLRRLWCRSVRRRINDVHRAEGALSQRSFSPTDLSACGTDSFYCQVTSSAAERSSGCSGN